MRVASYGSHGIKASDVATMKTKGRPCLDFDVFVLTKAGQVTLATYVRHNEVSQPEFLAAKDGYTLLIDKVKHWCYADAFKNKDGTYSGF